MTAPVSRLRLWWRRLRTLLWTALAMLIIAAAVLVGVGKLLLPYGERYKPQLEAVLAEQFNQPVRIDGFTAEWKPFGPRISLDGLTLLGGPEGTGAIALQQAALDIKPLNALLPGRPLYSFRLIGADLELLRLPDGRLELSGLGFSRGAEPRPQSGGLRDLTRVGELQLQDSSFSYRDLQQDLSFQLIDVNGRVQLDGNQLAAEVSASVSDRRRYRVLGDLSATLMMTMTDSQQLVDAAFHVETGDLLLADLAARLPEHRLKPQSGRVNARVWGSWTRGAGQEMAGVVDVRDAALDADGEPLLLDHLNARARWRWQDKTQWRLDLADVLVEESGRSWKSPRLTLERNLPGNLAMWVSADFLQAEFPMQLTRVLMRQFKARWPRVAPTAGSGPVENLDLVINSNRKLVSASGSFSDFTVTEWDRWPLLDAISGRADLSYGEGSLFISGEQVRVDWSRNFTAPLILDVPECELEILWGERWGVDARNCQLRNEQVDLLTRARFAQSEGKPVVDVVASGSIASLAALQPYWPRSVMSAKVTDWLGASLQAGEVSDLRFILSGDMDQFPFADRSGTLLAEAEISGAQLAYQPGWPQANDLQATVRFDGPAMVVRGRIGELAGSVVQQAQLRIADFKQPALELSYSSDTTLPALAEFLRASPMLRDVTFDLDQLAVAGPASTTGELRLPLGSTAGELQLEGGLSLRGSEFLERRSGLQLDQLQGLLRYSRYGFDARGLKAALAGQQVELDLMADWRDGTDFNAMLAGRLPAAILVGQTPLADDPLLARASGTAQWQATLSAQSMAAGQPAESWLELRSDLQGVRIDLPAPLDKAADSALPLLLRCPLQGAASTLTLTLGDTAALAFELGAAALGEGGPGPRSGMRPLRGAIQLGGDEPELPATGLLTVTGQAERLNLDGWVDVIVDLLGNTLGEEKLRFGGADLQADALIMLNRVFPDVALQVSSEAPALNARFQGDLLMGDVRYVRDEAGSHSLNAQFERLLLPNPLPPTGQLASDPTLLPELNIFVESFEYLGLDLGETRIEAFPIADGLRIESVVAQSPHLDFQARGDWIRNQDGDRSDFDILMTSESLGALVQAMDLSSVLEGGQTMVRYDAWWPGSPADFALARLNGEMSFSVVDGRVLNADPGAGRMLGLMSVTALPRRLALDFRDVFASGFGFDQANATVSLANGVAYTEDFSLESTAARLEIIGSSDLVAQEFDHTMSVRPGVSQALPVLGALAGGPAGAAAGLALQGLLRDSLGEAAEARYAITGPWGDPQVLRLDDESPDSDPQTSLPEVSMDMREDEQ